MANVQIPDLGPAIGLDGTEELEIVQAGQSMRTTTGAIATLAASSPGLVPDTRRVDTSVGLSGGGALSTDLTLSLDLDKLNAKAPMVVTDLFGIIDSEAANIPKKVTFPDALAAIAGLTNKPIPVPADDLVVLYSAADSAVRQSTIAQVLASAGSLPSGGTTGQPLIKQSNTDFDTVWATLPVGGGGTGQITHTNHGILLGQAASAIVATAAMSDGQLLVGQTGADPLPKSITGDVTFTAGGVTAIGANKVTDAMLRQSAGLSVIGRSASSTGNVADITGTADQVLRVAAAGASVGFGAIDLSKSAAVGTSILALANGGTNAALTASNGGLLYSTGAALAILAGTATAGQIPRSGSSAAPSWSTATYPATAAQGTVLNAGAANVISATAAPVLGNPGTTIGTLGLAGNTSGTVTITPQATAGTPTLTLPNASGTFAVSAAAPLTLNATTGALSITTGTLSKVDDANVTLTLGGTPTNALLNAVSITAGWSGQLGLTRGGTAASLTASNGGIVYSTASAMAILAGTATAGQMLRSGSSAAPAWSTATWPATTTASQLLYSSAANTVAGLATANRGVLNTDGSGVPSITATPTLGVNGGTGGSLALNGSTSGTATITVAAAAGTVNFRLPTSNGSNTNVLSTDGSGNTSWVAAGAGDVVGPGSATDNAVCRYDTTTGKVIQNSGVTIDDSANIATAGSILSSGTGGVGYATGAGGTVTQLTDKSTAVTLNAICGAITMNNAALAADTTVSFTLNNSTIALGDVLILNHGGGVGQASYVLQAQSTAGSAIIYVRNITAGSLSQGIVIRFAVIKSVTS